ncbi:hypothetical protein ACRC7T_13835 [Segnochrobactraceae bacterium EtOH-i3]
MTGTQIEMPGTASGGRYLIPPVARGLQALHLTRGSPAEAALNRARGGCGDGSVVGSPASVAGYISCRGLSDFIQSRMREYDELTFFTVAKTNASLADDANCPMYYGTYRNTSVDLSATSYGVGVYLSTAADVRGIASRLDGSVPPVRGSFPSVITDGSHRSAWALYVQTVTPDETLLCDLTNGLTGTVRTGTRDKSVGLFRIGSGYSDLGGTCQIAWWQGHSVALSDSEIEANAAWIADDLAAYGIMI